VIDALQVDAQQIEKLRKVAASVRRHDLQTVHGAKLGHVGGEMSAIDILVTLYFAVLSVDPQKPNDPDRDRFILSKGHSAVALYTTLAHRGFIPMEQLATFAQPMSKLNGHPDRNKVPGVETNTGPLGHGLPVGVGAALAAKLQDASWRVFVLTGDGELQEGSNWEAAMSAAHYKLDNLTVIVDRNRLQQGDWTEQTMHLEPLADKWRAFGWSVAEADGHNIGQLLQTVARLPFEPGKPSCIIAHTHKGQGVSFMRDRAAWHHKVPGAEEIEIALKELDEVPLRGTPEVTS
jgi:transketolase